MYNLMTFCSKKEHGEIGRHIIEGKFWYLGETINQLDVLLNEIKKVQNS